MSTYQVLLGLGGDSGLIRIGLPLLRQEPDACAGGRALRGRPLLVQQPERSRRKPVEDFWFTPTARLLDAVEHKKQTLESAWANPWNTRNCHPAHREWARDAARVFLAAREREEVARAAAGHPATSPVAVEWMGLTRLRRPDTRGADQYERTVWGRRYASADGSVREIWIPSMGTVKRDRPMVEIAAAAGVAATGIPVAVEYGQRAEELKGPNVLPSRVRIVGVGLGDGSVAVLADWDADEAVRQFDLHAKNRMAQAVDGRELQPGSDCTRCEGLAGCETIPKIPGLLGVSGPHRPRKRRSVSISDLRVHATCPARYHLTRVLNLKDGRSENEAIRRGRAVDAWLNKRHQERPWTACRHSALPGSLPGLAPEGGGPALDMIRQHRGHCPLDGLPATETVRPQWRLAVYDPVADTVVIADPDLLYTDMGGWVWRETKTAARRFSERRPLLSTFPQLALAVLLMASGVPGGDPRRSRIELEVLRADGATCQEIDPFDAANIDQARDVVSGLAAGWAADETYAPVPAPGFDCVDCEVRRWCAVGRGNAQATLSPSTEAGR